MAKIVPLHAKAVPLTIPKFVQRTFDMGVPLVDLTKANQLVAELDNIEFLKLTARLERKHKRNSKSAKAEIAKSAISKPAAPKRRHASA